MGCSGSKAMDPAEEAKREAEAVEAAVRAAAPEGIFFGSPDEEQWEDGWKLAFGDSYVKYSPQSLCRGAYRKTPRSCDGKPVWKLVGLDDVGMRWDYGAQHRAIWHWEGHWRCG